jgi:hypothetical protein
LQLLNQPFVIVDAAKYCCPERGWNLSGSVNSHRGQGRPPLEGALRTSLCVGPVLEPLETDVLVLCQLLSGQLANEVALADDLAPDLSPLILQMHIRADPRQRLSFSLLAFGPRRLLLGDAAVELVEAAVVWAGWLAD